MQRFLLAENARHLRARAMTVEAALRGRVEAMAAAAERELALFDAAGAGVRGPWDGLDEAELVGARAAAQSDFRRDYGDAPYAAALIDPRPGLVLAEVNASFEVAAGLSREALLGRPMFVLFPDNPNDARATGVANLFASLRRVAQTGREEAMPVQRYDIQDPAGVWRERYWLPVNRPVTDAARRVLYLLHLSEEAT